MISSFAQSIIVRTIYVARVPKWSKLDHFAEPEKVFEHHGRMLCIGWEKINGVPFCPLVCFVAIDLDKLLFHSRLMQPEVEQIFGEFTVVLQSIGSITIAESLIEALGVMSQ